MHELPITQSILDIALKEAKRVNAKKVYEIKIKMGECCDYVPEILQEYFNLLSEDTIAYEAKITVEKIKATLLCKDCNEIFNVEKFRMRCPKCNGRNTELKSGKEFYIDSLDIED